ncbi:aminodeoxychorismate/anthranilate synthase component II [Staphylococcus simiae]|uniref:anthranilate synthase component II n=1 Tax=Staphylococcus simiae TaxID=308354 RepID=UPI001A96D67E|nr:aminodeoxychorismate/anthranilate synthase component II [Staphylococcus simiae]MBO1198803.1 aminodeoxychorismate/anthranilate synthase component II [Staphylococcus simiae]MBO1200750.1 aminodeoxychorismate/anthranilate synthase component II [Staphylococcus simiae]MBO1203263.1 aminodeoxychorismate/anthranilate synthase component II [Staphylococcus simiae]MBO1210566.1 aminodeoxychorismate/anthranilate synthase component II [Staphylococcus simiae]MBO1229086.1 aminodeoxychorismate/anthranilate s
MIIVIDNNDSFTYNLIDYFATQTKENIEVISINELSLSYLQHHIPSAIVISPGPGKPEDYPILYDVLSMFANDIPILGVCLGFQILYTYFGGDVICNNYPVHGETTAIQHNNHGLFQGLPQDFNAMRYHSLMADIETLPPDIIVTARNKDNVIMGIAHNYLPLYGLQYHPESILSEFGHEQIKLFLQEVEHADDDNI